MITWRLKPRPKRQRTREAKNQKGSQQMAEEKTPATLVPVDIEAEMRKSYLDYAMSVIIGRALPDVRDGLKPVHRRILFGMHETSLTSTRPYRKRAKIVGEGLGKFHPHGDAPVYAALVHLAQPSTIHHPPQHDS